MISRRHHRVERRSRPARDRRRNEREVLPRAGVIDAEPPGEATSEVDAAVEELTQAGINTHGVVRSTIYGYAGRAIVDEAKNERTGTFGPGSGTVRASGDRYLSGGDIARPNHTILPPSDGRLPQLLARVSTSARPRPYSSDGPGTARAGITGLSSAISVMISRSV